MGVADGETPSLGRRACRERGQGDGGAANAEDDARVLDEAPALSLIVAVDAVHEGTARSLRDMLKVDRQRVVRVHRGFARGVALRSRGCQVVSYNAASRGDRFDRAAAEATRPDPRVSWTTASACRRAGLNA